MTMTISPTAASAPEAFGSHLPDGVERDNLERARRYLAAIEGSTNFGVFLTFRDGLIIRQRNYDCFQPF